MKKVRLQTLKEELDVFQMMENEAVDEFVKKLSKRSNKYFTLGSMIEHANPRKILLDSILVKYFLDVIGIKQFCDLKTMSFEEVIGQLKLNKERKVRYYGNAKNTDDLLKL